MDTTEHGAQVFESQTHFHIPVRNSALAQFSLQWRVVAMAFYDHLMLQLHHCSGGFCLSLKNLAYTDVTLTKLLVLATSSVLLPAIYNRHCQC